MTCHSLLYTQAQMLEPVRTSFAENRPIHWQRVNVLPDYVYFDHSIHIAKGVGCTTCDGPVGTMALMRPGPIIDHRMVPQLSPRSHPLPAGAFRGV